MLTSKEKRFVERLVSLAEEGEEIAVLERASGRGIKYIQDKDKIRLHAWLSNVKNIISNVFGKKSAQFKHLEELTVGNVEHSYEIYPIVGLLRGCANDLENGFLIGQEFLLAGEIFDSVLEQASYLNNKGYKDPAAILGRVVLEDSLKRIAREEGIDNDQKASSLNTQLWKADRYSKPQWRKIQAWLDIGNSAAHGEFDDYDQEDVKQLLDNISLFLARELS